MQKQLDLGLDEINDGDLRRDVTATAVQRMSGFSYLAISNEGWDDGSGGGRFMGVSSG